MTSRIIDHESVEPASPSNEKERTLSQLIITCELITLICKVTPPHFEKTSNWDEKF